ncbi:hypothetical protein KBTX_04488 [wastewater metagenome]|uniref:Peptidylprolyl isomerase n=2 Tax=unclassified sequences TaxID=12908 RepID=A0A5B8RK27_9ZZZZ|nr:hypothetical protein KBTEX_04488 [uncultured organism]
MFARVVDGMDVVDEMAGVPTGRASGMSDVPRQTLVIESAERVDG